MKQFIKVSGKEIYYGELDASEEHYDGVGLKLYPNGEMYYGNWRHGAFDGYGAYVYYDGRIRLSNWADNKLLDEGVVLKPEGDPFTLFWGTTEKNKPKRGIGLHKDGKIFCGVWTEWKGELFDGKGSFSWPDGRIYSGYWKNSRQDNGGVIVRPDGIVIGYLEKESSEDKTLILKNDSNRVMFYGRYRDESIRNGKGAMYYSDRSVYSGEFINGSREGLGFYKYLDGSIYIGEWKNDEANGRGMLYSPHNDREIYVGEFSDGLFDGDGCVFSVSTSGSDVKHCGEWSKGTQIIDWKTEIRKPEPQDIIPAQADETRNSDSKIDLKKNGMVAETVEKPFEAKTPVLEAKPVGANASAPTAESIEVNAHTPTAKPLEVKVPASEPNAVQKEKTSVVNTAPATASAPAPELAPDLKSETKKEPSNIPIVRDMSDDEVVQHVQYPKAKEPVNVKAILVAVGVLAMILIGYGIHWYIEDNMYTITYVEPVEDTSKNNSEYALDNNSEVADSTGDQNAGDTSAVTSEEITQNRIDANLSSGGEYSIDCFTRSGDSLAYDDEDYSSRRGIDVSYYQGNIDWQHVKDAGIEFAYIRAGFRGYGTEGKINLDKNFEENIRNAQAAGVEVGVYFFSQAITEEEAREEAEFVIDAIEPYSVDLPIAIEAVNRVNDGGRANNLSNEQILKNVEAFCETIIAAGYEPAVAFNKAQWEEFRPVFDGLGKYTFWYGDYELTEQPPFRCAFLQYANNGNIPGIGTNVDLNIQFLKK